MLAIINKSGIKKAGIRFVWGGGFVMLDQITKYLIRQNDGFYICNDGVAFGIKIPQTLLIVFLILFLLSGLTFLFIKRKSDFLANKIIRFGLILLLLGALSNIIDRFRWGCVIDFIDIGILNFPLFNLADILITIGAGLIIWGNLGDSSTDK